jgi:beta-N-acetylhexosaminidase
LRSRRTVLVVAAVSIGLLTALAITTSATPTAADGSGPSSQSAENAWVTRTLARMTLPEEVGQLFVVNGFGQSIRDPNPAMVKVNRAYYRVSNIAQLIQKFHPGGFIYFNWTNNLQSPAQIVGLSNGIQRIALSSGAEVPMAISTDQEQGEVLRIGPPATVFPGNMALGATGSLAYATKAAQITSVELRALGINIDNAPVVDVNVNQQNQADGVRSFGDRPSVVSGFARAQVLGYQTNAGSTGVGATAKHFPGLGDVALNSDTGAAISPQTLAQLEQTNLPSFRAAINAGVDQVMAGHVVFPRVTGRKVISSLSPFYVNGLLRTTLGYNGAVITDTLDAAALSAYTPSQVALMALAAGDDELLEIAQPVSLGGADKPPANLVSAYNAVLKAVRTGRLSKTRLDQSVVRILRLKWQLGLAKQATTSPSQWKRVVGTKAHLAFANTVANRSIVLLKNSAGVLPLSRGTGRKVLVTGFGQVTTTTLAQAIDANGLSAQALDTGSAPTSGMISQAVAAARQSNLVVVSTFNAWTPGDGGQIELVKQLLATGKPVIVAAVGTPYDIAYLPGVSTFVTSLDYQPVSLDALVRVLFGEVNPSGKLPVTITQPGKQTRILYPFGFGLSYR